MINVERDIDCGKKKLNALKYLSHICSLIQKVLHWEILSAVKFPMKLSKMAFEITMKPDQYHKFMTILQKKNLFKESNYYSSGIDRDLTTSM